MLAYANPAQTIPGPDVLTTHSETFEERPRGTANSARARSGSQSCLTSACAGGSKSRTAKATTVAVVRAALERRKRTVRSLVSALFPMVVRGGFSRFRRTTVQRSEGADCKPEAPPPGGPSLQRPTGALVSFSGQTSDRSTGRGFGAWALCLSKWRILPTM